MKEFFDYINTFSTKKKIVCSLSLLAFLYELFIVVCLALTYLGIDDSLRTNSIYSLLSNPILLCAFFPPCAIYIFLFPVMYVIVNIVYIYKMEFDFSILVFNVVAQIIHPATLVWSVLIFIAILNAFGIDIIDALF